VVLPPRQRIELDKLRAEVKRVSDQLNLAPRGGAESSGSGFFGFFQHTVSAKRFGKRWLKEVRNTKSVRQMRRRMGISARKVTTKTSRESYCGAIGLVETATDEGVGVKVAHTQAWPATYCPPRHHHAC